MNGYRMRKLDWLVADELDALAEEDVGGEPCGCADCVGREVLDEEDAERLRACGVLILLAPQVEPCEVEPWWDDGLDEVTRLLQVGWL